MTGTDPTASPSGPAAVVVEADGGSRGNPGPAAYGAVLKDAATGEVLAEDGATLGRATNNVAEYHGLLGGLRLAAELAPGARLEVRMDSKLVVEQMAGRWRVKHPGLQPLHEEARALAPAGTTWTWVPRARNAHADRLANQALDGAREGVTVSGARSGARSGAETGSARVWDMDPGAATTLVLVRHGVTAMTASKRFSGGLGGSDPALADDGRDQVRATAAWLAPLAEQAAAVVASPVRRTRESAEILAAVLERPLVEEPDFAEMEFGGWDGLTFAEVRERHADDLAAWLGSADLPAGGTETPGESLRGVEQRVLAGLDRTLAAYAGQLVVVVSHVTPIKVLVSRALGVPVETAFRMELAPAAVSVVSFWPGGDGSGEPGRGSLRLFNARPPEAGGLGVAATTW